MSRFLLTLTASLLGLGVTGAEAQARPGHNGGARSGNQRSAPGRFSPSSVRPVHRGRSPGQYQGRRPGRHYSIGRVYRGRHYRHHVYSGRWRGWHHRRWFPRWNRWLYWAPEDGAWYYYTPDDGGAFVPVDDMTYEDVDDDDGDDY